jgi:hypothetical protein
VSVWDILITVCLGLLLCATALTQFRSKSPFISRMKSHDIFALIPIWTFFAPNPGTYDQRIMWRDILVDGTYGPWREINPPQWNLRRAIWNPKKRQRKAIGDAANILIRKLRKKPNRRLLPVSIPYIMIMHQVAGYPRSPFAAGRQFLIARTTGEDPAGRTSKPLVIFTSSRHGLSPKIASRLVIPAVAGRDK